MLDVADAQAVGCLQHGRRVGHDRRRQVVGVGRIVTADGFNDKRNPVEPSDSAPTVSPGPTAALSDRRG